MKHMKSRLFGLILLVLGAAILLTGVSAHVAEREGTPLHSAYTAMNAEIEARGALESALTSAAEALPRSEKRVSDALALINPCLEEAQSALDRENELSFDPETEIGALGQAIVDARTEDNDLQDVFDAYSPVANQSLSEALTEAKGETDRAENAIADTTESVQKLIDAALALDPSASFDALPEFTPVEVPKLGDRKGANRLLTRANNYLTRATAAQDGALAIREAGEAVIAAAQSVLGAHPLSLRTKLITFACSRYLDLLVYGGALALAGLLLLLVPAWLALRWRNPFFRKGFGFALVVAALAAALHYAPGETWALMRQGTFDTLYMTIPATIFSYLLGLPLGVLLVITSPGHIKANGTVNSVVGTVVNFLRSIPFIILLVMLFDVTRLVMGSAIGTRAIIFPLFVSAFPYVARIVEGSLAEVDRGVVEAAQSMGSTTWQIIRKVLVPEALPSLINGAAICMTTILSYTAMAGSAGGDGLGKIAITYGLNYRNYEVMYISSLLLVALVQIIQIAGGILTRACDHRKR